jgi:hypothetical protein
MMIEQHSSDLGHMVTHHLIPTALVVAFVYGVIVLMVKLATRRGQGRGPIKVGGLNRQTRRRERAMRRRKR